VTITDATTLAELRDELEPLGIVQIGVRLHTARSTVSILGAARVGLGDYRTFEAGGGTIGEALAAACAKVAVIRAELVAEGGSCDRCRGRLDNARSAGKRAYCVKCSYVVEP
jgi:hypothetical protein